MPPRGPYHACDRQHGQYHPPAGRHPRCAGAAPSHGESCLVSFMSASAGLPRPAGWHAWPCTPCALLHRCPVSFRSAVLTGGAGFRCPAQRCGAPLGGGGRPQWAGARLPGARARPSQPRNGVGAAHGGGGASGGAHTAACESSFLSSGGAHTAACESSFLSSGGAHTAACESSFPLFLAPFT